MKTMHSGAGAIRSLTARVFGRIVAARHRPWPGIARLSPARVSSAFVARALMVPALMALVLGATQPVLAQAQPFPSKPVRLILGYPAGGLTDVLARAMAQEISKTWGQQLVVENRPGANQIIASEFVARSAPDGHTLLLVDSSAIILNPLLYSKLPYDPTRDFQPVLNLTLVPDMLVASPNFPAANLQEFLRVARERAGTATVSYGTFGLGSLTHVDTEAFGILAGVKLHHIPYKGIAEVLPALASGQIDVALSGIPPLPGLVKQGRIKAIALASNRRSPAMPDVPTFAEAGGPDFDSHAWFGIVAPAAVPRPIVDRIAADLGRVISQPAFNEKYIGGAGMELLNHGPEQFAETIKVDAAAYTQRVRSNNIRLE
jgi:tripartite-type tricarboxylate transporter receptor subunit TctC